MQSLLAEYAHVKNLRLALEQKAKELATGPEAELKARILARMSAEGASSINIPTVGRVVLRAKTHYEITDINVLMMRMFQLMVEAAQNGRPLVDALLLQKRVSKEMLETYVAGSDEGLFGVKKKDEADITFTPIKGA